MKLDQGIYQDLVHNMNQAIIQKFGSYAAFYRQDSKMLPPTSWSRILNGGSKMSLDTFSRICTGLGISDAHLTPDVKLGSVTLHEYLGLRNDVIFHSIIKIMAL